MILLSYAAAMSRGESPITEVLYVAKTHLDVGFTATGAAVRDRYLTEFFPAAIDVATQLRAEGGPARLRWTTGAWILLEALEASSGEERARLERAVIEGDLRWQALPFTLHTELCDRSLLHHAMSLSAELDRRFECRTRAAKMTDVPGHARSMVSVLAEAGVDFLHIGVNPAASAPDVPMQFLWRDPSASGHSAPDQTSGDAPTVSVMYQPASYGDVQVVEETTTAVVIDLTGDNIGPPDAATVRERFVDLAARFPNATLRAATLEDVADVVRTSTAEWPVLDAEIGDTWLHGTASDPPKLAAFRALCRRRRNWIDHGVDPHDPAVARASTRLLLVAEHTWGLDQKTHWPETGYWSADELAARRGDRDTRAFESSWAEQRDHLHEFCDELDAAHPVLAAAARADVSNALDPTPRFVHESLPTGATTPAVAIAAGEPVRLAGFECVIDHTGALCSLIDPTGRNWVAPGHRLGSLRERTFDADDYERWFSTYNGATRDEDEWWARWDNTKPGLESSGARSRWWPVRLAGAELGSGPDGEHLRVELVLECNAEDPVALRSPVTMTIRPVSDSEVEFSLLWRRQAARWPEATWWGFEPLADPSGWQMLKIGEWVDPSHVVPGGATLHAVDELRHVNGMQLTPLNAPLVSADPETLLRWAPALTGEHAGQVEPSQRSGWHFLLQANLWGTNFPMWIDDWCTARVRLSHRGP